MTVVSEGGRQWMWVVGKDDGLERRATHKRGVIVEEER